MFYLLVHTLYKKKKKTDKLKILLQYRHHMEVTWVGPKFLLVGVIKADSVRGGASNFISWLKYLTEEKPESLSTVTRARPRPGDRLLLED